MKRNNSKYWLITSGVTIISLGIFLSSCVQKNERNANSGVHNQLDSQNVSTKPLKDNPYRKLRNMALNVTPEQLELKLLSNKTVVYGIVMDWNTGDNVCTVAAFQTGDASIYLSSGQVYIGGGQHVNIHDEAISFVESSQNYLKRTIHVDSTPLPDRDYTRFYFLTNKGRFYAEENVRDLKNKSDEFMQLIEQGQKLITDYREQSSEN